MSEVQFSASDPFPIGMSDICHSQYSSSWSGREWNFVLGVLVWLGPATACKASVGVEAKRFVSLTRKRCSQRATCTSLY